MQLIIGLLLLGGAIGLVIYAILSQMNEKSVVRELAPSARRLRGGERP